MVFDTTRVSKTGHFDHNYRRYASPFVRENTRLSENVSLDMDIHKTKRNNNVLVFGGAQSGKRRSFIEPNLCSMPLNTNFVVYDPYGETLENIGNILEGNGYKIQVIDLRDENASCHYNPFEYLNTDEDVIELADNLLANTDAFDKNASEFWQSAQRICLLAVLFLVRDHGDELGIKKTLPAVLELINRDFEDAEGTKEEGTTPSSKSNDAESKTATDKHSTVMSDRAKKLAKSMAESLDRNKDHGLAYYFDRIKDAGEGDMALKFYKNLRIVTDAGIDKILTALSVRLSVFEISSIRTLMSEDTLDLEDLAKEKTALFVIGAFVDNQMKPILATLFAQIRNELYYLAEFKYQDSCVVRDADGEIVKIFPESESPASANAEADSRSAKDMAYDCCSQISDCLYAEQTGKYITLVGAYGENIGGIYTNRYTNPQKAAARMRAMREKLEVTHTAYGLPYHVRFILDNISGVGKINDLPKWLTTFRSYNVSAIIMTESVNELIALYGLDGAKNIALNCDSTVYLGEGDAETRKFISVICGKADNDKTGDKSLICPQKLELLPEDECIVKIRMAAPFRDKKICPEAQSWYYLTSEAGMPAYRFEPEKAHKTGDVNFGEKFGEEEENPPVMDND